MRSISRWLTGRALSIRAAVALANSPKGGSPAPDFRLQDQTGKWVSLKEQRGKWVVLYFYPKDNTPGCTTQACEFRDDIFAFRREGAVIYGAAEDAWYVRDRPSRHLHHRSRGSHRQALGKSRC